jgi:hypothetical protein
MNEEKNLEKVMDRDLRMYFIHFFSEYYECIKDTWKRMSLVWNDNITNQDTDAQILNLFTTNELIMGWLPDCKEVKQDQDQKNRILPTQWGDSELKLYLDMFQKRGFKYELSQTPNCSIKWPTIKLFFPPNPYYITIELLRCNVTSNSLVLYQMSHKERMVDTSRVFDTKKLFEFVKLQYIKYMARKTMKSKNESVSNSLEIPLDDQTDVQVI